MSQTQDTENQYYDSPINATIYEIQKICWEQTDILFL